MCSLCATATQSKSDAVSVEELLELNLNSQAVSIPESTRLDLHIGWLPTKHIETSLLLTNAIRDATGEAVERNLVNTGLLSSFYFQLKYIH